MRPLTRPLCRTSSLKWCAATRPWHRAHFFRRERRTEDGSDLGIAPAPQKLCKRHIPRMPIKSDPKALERSNSGKFGGSACPSKRRNQRQLGGRSRPGFPNGGGRLRPRRPAPEVRGEPPCSTCQRRYSWPLGARAAHSWRRMHLSDDTISMKALTNFLMSSAVLSSPSDTRSTPLRSSSGSSSASTVADAL